MTYNKQKEAWSVYVEHQGVFAAVLKATGPWAIQDGVDLVHDFLIDRLPQVLVTYDPKRGPIRPWLFTVFSRYAKRRLLERASIEKRWSSLESIEDTSQQDAAESLTTNQRELLCQAMDKLPEELRLSLLSYFGEGLESGNIRALARKFSWSRHRTRQNLLMALAAIAAQIKEQGILTEEELEVCYAHLVHGETWQAIANRLRKSEHKARLLMKSALTKLGASLTKV